MLILIGTIVFAVKTKGEKKYSNIVYLLFVLSIATVIWGAITGTWFGMESAMNVPFLKALVIPSFANYPDYFGVTALAQQNTIMKFSFSVGAIQMALGSLISDFCIWQRRKVRHAQRQKDLQHFLRLPEYY